MKKTIAAIWLGLMLAACVVIVLQMPDALLISIAKCFGMVFGIATLAGLTAWAALELL
jgi:hypothetical protein